MAIGKLMSSPKIGDVLALNADLSEQYVIMDINYYNNWEDVIYSFIMLRIDIPTKDTIEIPYAFIKNYARTGALEPITHMENIELLYAIPKE